jgi:hypothetical protein
MPSATITRIRKSKPPSVHWLRWLGAAVIAVVVTVGGAELLQGPQFVPRVTFVNPSPYTIEMQVSDADRDGWTVLGPIEANGTSSVEQIIDQGDAWVFRTQAQGVSGGEFTSSRSALERSNWRVTIPSSVIDRLRDQNISASPTAN